MHSWIAIALVAVTGTLGVYLVWRAIADVAYGRASRHWPVARGTIERVEIKRLPGRGSTEWMIVPTYTYVVDGKTYSASRTCFVNAAAFRADTRVDAERLLTHYPPGRRIDVRFAPTRPARCTLQPGVDFAGAINCAVMLILGALMLVIAFLFSGFWR